jgi:hypothetical protein
LLQSEPNVVRPAQVCPVAEGIFHPLMPGKKKPLCSFNCIQDVFIHRCVQLLSITTHR